MKLQRLVQLACVGLLILCSVPAIAQSYPNRPIRLEVGFAPGGAADLVARLIGESLSHKLKTPVVVIDTPGAGSVIAADAVARAVPDGYTLFLATASLAINPYIYKSVNYDPIKDFIPIADVAASPFYIIVQAKSKFGSLRQLIDTAKKHPGLLTYSSGGVGSFGNVSEELLARQAGVKILQVPFRGEAPEVVALMRGTVDMSFVDLAPVRGFINDGRLKALATTAAQRTRWLPNVPTIAESAVPGYSVEQWFAIFTPAGVPDSIVKVLHDSLNEILKNSDEAFKARYNVLGVEIPKLQTQQEFAKFVQGQVSLWRNTIKKVHIKE